MDYGSKPTDNGNFLFTDKEKKEFIKQEPQAKKYFKPLLSSREYINGEKRWCLWLVEADPKELKKMHLVLERIEAVKKFRLASPKLASPKLQENSQDTLHYLEKLDSPIPIFYSFRLFHQKEENIFLWVSFQKIT